MAEDLEPIRSVGDLADLIALARARTPARILVGRAGSSYRTATQLQLREDHAAAVDAVQAEVDLDRDLGRDFVATWALFEVPTQARDKAEYLLRPATGRRLADEAADRLRRCPSGADLQVVIGDGLSASAVAAQVPDLLPRLAAGAARLGWSFGRPFFIRHCRVGALNDVGDRLGPTVAVLLMASGRAWRRPKASRPTSLTAPGLGRPTPTGT